jgi:hypothetical protein
MPEVNFSQISKLFNTKASDRLENIQPGDGNPTSAVHATAAESIGPEGANARPGYAQSEKGAEDRGGLKDPSRKQMRLPYGGQQGSGGVRVGFVLTSDLWRQEDRALVLHAGPASASWSLALRAQNEENKAGHARYAQARHAGHGNHDDPSLTYFDLPKVQFQFQAGNILPIPEFQNEVSLAYGLQDFYKFFELLNQPPLIPAGQYEGKHNYTWVFYTSLHFPQVTLKGYFDPEGLTWEDNAEAPTTLTWNASFLAHEMSPAPWEYDELSVAYRDFMRDTVRLF